MLQKIRNISIGQYIGEHIKDMEKQTLTLTSGDQMPLSGFGTWKIPASQCQTIVYEALQAGYRLLDCACDYGNEKKVGLGIKKAIEQNVLTRKELFVTSKLWNTFHRTQHVQSACRRTLSDLGLEYLDLYLIHFPISLKYVDPETRYPPEWLHDDLIENPCMIEDPVPIIETWRAMQELVKKGLVRNIGVSNFGVSLLRDLITSSSIKPAVLQIQLHPLLSQKKLVRFCKINKIQVTAYSSFGGQSYIELQGSTADESLINNETIKKIATKNNKSTAQILLKWAIQQQIAVIPKTLKKERLQENRDLFSWTLSEEDVKELDGLNRNLRYNDPGVYCEKYFKLFFPIFE